MINIIIFEDDKHDYDLIKGIIYGIADKNGYPKESISLIHTEGLDSTKSQLDNIQNITFVILDILIGNKNPEKIGTKILQYIKTKDMKINVIIFSNHNEVQFSDYKQLYPCVKEVFSKGDHTKIQRYIEDTYFPEKIKPEEVYELKNQYDYILCHQIKNIITENEFAKHINQLVTKLREEGKVIISPVCIERFTSGFSGAFIFKVTCKDENENKYIRLIKISSHREGIKEELSNYEHHNGEVPGNMKLDIKKLYDGECSSLFMVLVQDSKTLFDYLIDKDSKKEEIEELLRVIFGKLKSDTYSKKVKEKNYISLTNKERISVEAKIEYLSPVLKNLDKHGYERIQKRINKITDSLAYEDFNSYTNSKDLLKQYILCHGDLHARNILVDTNNSIPTIIDYAHFGYHHWASDFSRLIVQLFMEGIDYDTSERFDIHNQYEKLKLAQKILRREEIDIDKGKKGIIDAINWLIVNVQDYFPDHFRLWDFQLALGIEFLRIIQWDSYPDSKKILAVYAADFAIETASQNFKTEDEKKAI